jgi:hypothetical protein
LQEAGEVVELALHVGVVEVAVPFAATPEGVAFEPPSSRVTSIAFFTCAPHRRRRRHSGWWRRRGIAFVAEEVGGAPEQLDAGAVLLFLQHLDHSIEVLVALGQGLAFGGDIAVVEAVEADAQFLQELESDADTLLSHLDAVGAIFPGTHGTAWTERISPGATEGMPVGDGEAEPVVHGLAFDDFVRLIVLEAERILAGGAFVLNLRGYFGKVSHGFLFAWWDND